MAHPMAEDLFATLRALTARCEDLAFDDTTAVQCVLLQIAGLHLHAAEAAFGRYLASVLPPTSFEEEPPL